jgi:hypothetical protein
MTMRSGIAMAALFALGAHSALADDCARVADSIAKEYHTPNKSQTMMTASGKPVLSGHGVRVGGKDYLHIGGAPWKIVSIDADKDEKSYRERISTDRRVCQVTGTEIVNGEMADIITVHQEDKSGDDRYWVSQSSGLLMQSVGLIEMNGVQLTVSQIFDYRDVQPPPDAN